jgi:thioredoxin-dependent peroxiredoxin
MIHPDSPQGLAGKLTVRSVFVIDPSKKLRMTLTYPASVGRNFNELLRVIDSLQLTDSYKVATPVNWNKGDEVVVVPSLTDEEATAKFPKGFRAVKPYLRLTPDPSV